LQKKLSDEKCENFSFRVKLGEYEVELCGTHRDVMRTVERLPTLITNVSKAFDNARPKTIAKITVKTTDSVQEIKPSEIKAVEFPKIISTYNTQKAGLQILESDWGKWRPRNVEEIADAMKANNMEFPGRVIESVLEGLAEKGLVRRWNTNTGFVYIIADQTNVNSEGEQ
jgi:hypothetical protein